MTGRSAQRVGGAYSNEAEFEPITWPELCGMITAIGMFAGIGAIFGDSGARDGDTAGYGASLGAGCIFLFYSLFQAYDASRGQSQQRYLKLVGAATMLPVATLLLDLYVNRDINRAGTLAGAVTTLSVSIALFAANKGLRQEYAEQKQKGSQKEYPKITKYGLQALQLGFSCLTAFLISSYVDKQESLGLTMGVAVVSSLTSALFLWGEARPPRPLYMAAPEMT